MKKLQNLKNSKNMNYSELAGVSFKKERIVGVNIELLWKHAKKDTKFIPLFSEYYTHEFLHIYLRDIGNPIGEERVIRRLLGQSFSKDEQRYYAKFYK